MCDLSVCPQPAAEGKSDGAEEGRRMGLLRESLDKTVRRWLSAGKLSLFIKNWPELYEKKPNSLRYAQEQLLYYLKINIQKEIELIFEEENLCALMNKLDELCQEAAGSDIAQAWRPSGKPADDVRSHVVPEKQKHRDQCRQYLEQLEEENKKLKQAVVTRQQQLLKTKRKIEETTDYFQKATEVCKIISTDDLVAFTLDHKSILNLTND